MKAILLLGAGLLLSMGSVAQAASFTFSYSGPNSLAGNVLISGSETSPGVFDILSGTDAVTGGTSLTGVFAIFANPSFPAQAVGSRFDYDDALYPASPVFLGNGGLLFSNASGFINLYSAGSDFLSGTSTTPATSDVKITVSGLSVVAEPTSIAVLGACLVGFAAIRRAVKGL